MVAIMNLYLEGGCPEDGSVRVSRHRLLRAAGLHAGAHYQREVRQCLRRVHSTSHQITQGWRSQGRQRHMDTNFNYLWRVAAIREDEYDAGSVPEIRLPDEVAQSVREGYVQPLERTAVPGAQPSTRPGRVEGPRRPPLGLRLCSGPCDAQLAGMGRAPQHLQH